MRRLLQIIIALFAILAPSTMWAYDFEVDGIFYYYTNQTSVAVTTGPRQYSGDVTIPAAVNYNGTAFSVVGIDTWAFTGCSDLTSVTIPATVTSIGDYAFGECSGLNSIIVDAGNPTYDSRNNCNALIETATNTLIAGCKNTVIPNSVTGIRYCAFIGCTGLTGLIIPNSITYIDVKAFQNCSALRSIAIPNSVTYIGGEAFKYCSGLSMVTIPNSVTYIGSEVFDDCTSLMDVYSYITDLQGVTVGYNVFRSSADYSGRTLHVPHGTAGAYQADRNWYPYFGQIVEMGPVTHPSGDVNADQEVTIADVMAAVDIILGGEFASAADVNSDGEVNIADINAIIDIILNGGAPTPQGPDYVDLGLPSGTLWATRNVGASSPEQGGDYFAWGEIEPKEVYDMSTYKWCNDSVRTLTKYCTDSTFGYNGFVDGKTELDPEDDAAWVNWGPAWRMPSQEQMDELCRHCNWQDTTRNDVNGFLVTGPNGNTIFLPNAGLRYVRSLHDAAAYGNYWTRTLNSAETYDADCLRLSGAWRLDSYDRSRGLSVRPVRATD